jgi:hypothetical protein
MNKLTIVVLIAASIAAAHADLSSWCDRVLTNIDQPEWKVELALKALDGGYQTFKAVLTPYSDKDYLDPGTGGGPVGCTWHNPDGRTLRSVILRYGQIASYPHWWPTGTVIYFDEPFDHTMVVTDCFGDWRRRDKKARSRFDVYLPDRNTWQMYHDSVKGPVRVYVLGRITRAQLLSSYTGNPSR